MSCWSFARILPALISFAFTASAGAATPPKLPELVVYERNCALILTEARILVKHIAESSAELKTLFTHYEEQSRNWRAFLNGRAVDFIHVVHQTGIKQLNEEIWNMSGTEEYLEAFHDQLHQYLRLNPHFGAVLHNDYKNHFISSSLDARGFGELVVKPVSEQLARRMNARLPEWGWDDWISSTVFHGTGKTPAEAYFRAGLQRTRYSRPDHGVSLAEWQASAIARRERLIKGAAEKGVAWETMLAVLHIYAGRGTQDAVALGRWLQMHGLSELREDLLIYCDNLQIADFHPLPESAGIPTSLEEFMANKQADSMNSPRGNWALERRALFLAAADARYIAVTDVQGLGGIARRFQDQWIARGAKLEELQTVYAQSTTALEAFFAETYVRLKELLGEDAPIHVYRSGDDAIWFLPAMDGKVRRAVHALFRDLRDTGREHDTLELKLHHSKLVPVRPELDVSEGMAEALTKARHSLFTGKKKLK